MAYSPDPDARSPLPRGFWRGLALLLIGAALACFALPLALTGALALIGA